VRILQVCAVDFTAYHLLRPLMLASRDEGWEVEFACADGPFAAKLRQEGFRHRPVPMTRAASPLRQVRAALALAADLRRRPPHVIHTHTPVGGLVGRAASLAWSGPVVHTFHGMPFAGEPTSLPERAFLVVERLLARRTALFFSQARGDAARAAALGIARTADTIVIGNGVDLGRFRPDAAARGEVRASLGLPADAVVSLTVARLVREKGLLELADAAVVLEGDTRMHYVLVGAALESDRTAVTRELDEHPVVRRLGARWRRLGHRMDVDRLLQAADLFVLPSYREGLPRSVIEAMACGLPVVTTDIPACRELVREGETGLLIPPRDPRALGRAIARVAGEGELRARMGARALAIAVSEHDERRVLRLQLDRLRDLVRP
jgi:glycosyltransferase involved in cell wall biosynthesis